MENMMHLGNVLGSQNYRNLLKLQAMHSGGRMEDPIPYECLSSSSVNSMPLHYDAMPRDQDLQHLVSKSCELAAMSSTSSPSFNTMPDDVALTNLLALAESATLPQVPYKRDQDEELDGKVLKSLPTYIGQRHSPHAFGTSIIPYISHGTLDSSALSVYRDSLSQSQVQHDSYGCPHISNYMECLMTNCGQDPNTVISFDRGGNHQMAASSTSSSSSSSTPSSMSAGVTQLVKERLQAWIALESPSYNPALTDLHDVYEREDAHNIQEKKNDSVAQNSVVSHNGSIAGDILEGTVSAMVVSTNQEPKKKTQKKRKRKRMSQYKNVEDMETQRMTHIAVERNRRKQMNEHLRTLRLLMPHSYIQRGDQASIVGGTIRFVEELEQVLQSLRLQKQLQAHHQLDQHVDQTYANTRSRVAKVEVRMPTSSTVFINVLAQKKPHRLFHTLLALSKLCLRVTDLKITTMGVMLIYAFRLEVDDGGRNIFTPLGLAQSIQHTFLTEIEDTQL